MLPNNSVITSGARDLAHELRTVRTSAHLSHLASTETQEQFRLKPFIITGLVNTFGTISGPSKIQDLQIALHSVTILLRELLYRQGL